MNCRRVPCTPLSVEAVQSRRGGLGVDRGVDRLDGLGDRVAVLTSRVAERAPDQVDDTRLDDGVGERRPHGLGQPFEPVADQEEDVGHPTVLQLGQHRQPVLGRLAVSLAGPHPEHVTPAVEVHTDGSVDRPRPDLTVADDVQRVDEHRGIHPLQRAGVPRGHLLDHPVGDPGDGVLGHLGAVDVGEMGADLPGGQPTGIQRQDHLIDIGETTLTLLDNLRLEGARPIPRHVDLNTAAGIGQHRLGSESVAGVATSVSSRVPAVIAQVLAELLVQGGLDDRLGHRLEQPARARQRNARLTRLAHQLASDLQLIDPTGVGDIDRRRSGLNFRFL